MISCAAIIFDVPSKIWNFSKFYIMETFVLKLNNRVMTELAGFILTRSMNLQYLLKCMQLAVRVYA